MHDFAKIEELSTQMVMSFSQGEALDENSISLIISMLRNYNGLTLNGREVLEKYLMSLRKDKSFTYDHSVKVAWLVLKLAQWMGFSEADRRLLMILGLLHDIGKIGMPESLLNKTDRLTEKEFDLIKTHPEYSAKWLNAADCFSDKIIDIVASHHEKGNGMGYPNGKIARDIDDMTKMLTISDIFEALTAVRPYKSAFTMSKSLEIMNRMSEHNELDSEIFGIFRKHMLILSTDVVPKMKVGLLYRNVDIEIIGYDEALKAPICKIMQNVRG